MNFCFFMLTVVAGESRLPNGDALAIAAQRKALLATVRIHAVGKRTGTGTLIGRDRNGHFILTANHVIAGGHELQVDVFSDTSSTWPTLLFTTGIDIVAANPNTDLAIIYVKTAEELPHPIPICPPGFQPSGLFPIFTVGCSQGLHPSIIHGETKGTRMSPIISGFVWELTANSVPGRSGGGLFEGSLLVGVCYGSTSEGKGIYQNLPAIYEILDQAGLTALYASSGAILHTQDFVALVVKIIVAKAILFQILRRRRKVT